jgi:glyoxylase I family protein
MIEGINHYNLRADQETIEALKDFYIEIVGLNLGHRPPFKNGGYWLYANQKDVLHLSFSKNDIVNELNVNSTFDHMAFTCQDEDMYIELLTKKTLSIQFVKFLKLELVKFFSKTRLGTVSS